MVFSPPLCLYYLYRVCIVRERHSSSCRKAGHTGGGDLGARPDPLPFFPPRPAPQYSRQEQEEEGRKRYEAQKLERMETKWRNGDIVQPVLNPGRSRAAVWG